ncbi:hypothetical protein G3O08_17895 [Cryomorpha ignava]|uniref:DUF3037 domain-containing protein n=1 Tax=Cryomorpha ignava TaxID=101383 RepID=A0A7K3WWZ2_9FLAO|nr:hypothetical protein [Cryomorpha ignava]NEN25372.1 hypothetical protein [Cryomorpha ignava]
MENHIITILKVPVSQYSNEFLAIGLFASDGKESFFRVSNHKLKVLKRLISDDSYYLMDSKVKMIKKDFDLNTGEGKIHFDLNHTLFSDSHLAYLSKYANNVLQFEKPQSIDLPLNDEVFDQIFSRYVSEKSNTKKPVVTRFKTTILHTLKPQIEDRVTWDAVIDKDRVQGLIFPKITFDFAGLNSGLVLGQAQDFSKEYKDVRDELATLYSVVGLDHDISQIFLVGKEPDKSQGYNHQLWSEFRVLKGITYIESESNLGEVVDFVRSHDVVPLPELP